MLEKIIIAVCTLITTASPFFIKWLIKKKKKKYEFLHTHPIFTLINETNYQLKNNLLEIRSNYEIKPREMLYSVFVDATIHEWEKLFRGAIQNDLKFEGKLLLEGDVFSKWMYGFLDHQMIRMVTPYPYGYGLPKSFIEKYNQRIGNDLTIQTNEMITRAFNYPSSHHVEKFWVLLDIMEHFIKLMMISLKHYLEYGNGEVTEILKQWQEDIGEVTK